MQHWFLNSLLLSYTSFAGNESGQTARVLPQKVGGAVVLTVASQQPFLSKQHLVPGPSFPGQQNSPQYLKPTHWSSVLIWDQLLYVIHDDVTGLRVVGHVVAKEKNTLFFTGLA